MTSSSNPQLGHSSNSRSWVKIPILRACALTCSSCRAIAISPSIPPSFLDLLVWLTAIPLLPPAAAYRLRHPCDPEARRSFAKGSYKARIFLGPSGFLLSRAVHPAQRLHHTGTRSKIAAKGHTRRFVQSCVAIQSFVMSGKGRTGSRPSHPTEAARINSNILPLGPEMSDNSVTVPG